MAYFVASLPKSCFFCDCCHTREYDSRYKIDGEKFCGIENMEVDSHYDHHKYNNDGRPKWCPLREIPKEINIRQVPYEADYYSYSMGWNDCLDKMNNT